MSLKAISAADLAALVDQAQDVATIADRMATAINRGVKPEPGHVVRTAMYLLTASSGIAELARVMLMAPGLDEASREIETRLRADLAAEGGG